MTTSIPRFIDFFVSDQYLYLVTEYISDVTLADFVETAMIYIKQNRLDLKEWRKFVKYIAWQLVATIYWLHNDLCVTHLDITMVCLFSNFFALNADRVNSDIYVYTAKHYGQRW